MYMSPKVRAPEDDVTRAECRARSLVGAERRLQGRDTRLNMLDLCLILLLAHQGLERAMCSVRLIRRRSG
jgi:hypothetical protein